MPSTTPRPLTESEFPYAKRFWAKVQKTATCWIWTGARADTQYGSFRIGGRACGSAHGAHRVAYEMAVGPIPPGLHIDHLCRNRSCVNPAHLEPVTQAENNRRSREAKRCQAAGWDDEHPNRECGATALYEVPPSHYGHSHWLACPEHVTRHEGDVVELASGETWTVGT